MESSSAINSLLSRVRTPTQWLSRTAGSVLAQIETVDISLADDVPRVWKSFKTIHHFNREIVMAEEFRRATISYGAQLRLFPNSVTFEPHTQFNLRRSWPIGLIRTATLFSTRT